MDAGKSPSVRSAGLLAALAILPPMLPALAAAAPASETPCCCRADGAPHEAGGPCRMCDLAPEANGRPILRTCAPEGSALGPISFAPIESPPIFAARVERPLGRIASAPHVSRADFSPEPFSPPPRILLFG